MISAEEEGAFRQAVRSAILRLKDGGNIAIISKTDGVPDVDYPTFSVVNLEESRLGIIIPIGWDEQDGMEARLLGLIRQERAQLEGRPLD